MNTTELEGNWDEQKGKLKQQFAKNEARIAGLKSDLKKQGKAMDASYEKSVAELEAKNEAMKAKLNDYETTQTDWNEFKREFNSDMSDLGDAFNNLTVNNKN